MTEPAVIVGEYVVAESAGEFAVYFVRDDAPAWWHVIARFHSRDRAEDYCETENGLMDDFEGDHRHDDVTLVVPAIEPAHVKLPKPEKGAPQSAQVGEFLVGEARHVGQVDPDEIAARAAALFAAKAAERENNIQIPDELAASEPPGAGLDVEDEDEIVLAPPAPAREAEIAPEPRRRETHTKHARFAGHTGGDPTKVTGLSADHPAIKGARSLFPTTVVNPADSPRLLVSGDNNRKLGKRVTKGPWAGMPIYQLTLEERATCPVSCFHWRTCFGNGMPQTRRHSLDGLVTTLTAELGMLNRQHPDGFVVRLHTLGDFWSVAYVDFWRGAIETYDALRVFGYTARARGSTIGKEIASLAGKSWDRFAIRFSGPDPKPQGATTIFTLPDDDTPGIICPAETGKTECCATCGLCWHPNAREKCITFLAHGPTFSGRPKKAETSPTRGPVLNDRQEAIWRAAAEIISETGLSPDYKTIAQRANTTADHIAVQTKNIERKGFWKRVGVARSMVLHIVTWPEGVTPRETSGRADGGVAGHPQAMSNLPTSEDIDAFIAKNGVSREVDWGEDSDVVGWLKWMGIAVARPAKSSRGFEFLYSGAAINRQRLYTNAKANGWRRGMKAGDVPSAPESTDENEATA